jgi:hypothetical protein
MKVHSIFCITFYFYYATFNNMQQAKCITKSTNVSRFGKKITHRYHSVETFYNSRRKSLGQYLFSRRGGFWGRVRELRAWTRGLSWRWKEEWKDL